MARVFLCISAVALSLTIVTAQGVQDITKKDSQGYGTAFCDQCGTKTDTETAALGLSGTAISSCFLPYGGLAEGDSTNGADKTVFECSCKPAFTGDGITCDNVNECTARTDYCDNNAQCIDTPGSFRCECPNGYETQNSGKTCDDIDECATGSPCGGVGTCTNYEGGYTCDCNTGYKNSNTTKNDCVDIDECDSGTVCTLDHESCTNTAGSYGCYCEAGYTYNADQSACVDVNECDEGLDTCDEHATCANTGGSFTCSCNSGFNGDGYTCEDNDECTSGAATCPDNNRGQCKNTEGGFECECDSGYELYQWRLRGFTAQEFCRDIDECKSDSNSCSDDAQCTNSPGSYSCKCKEGFTGDGNTCTDNDECTSGVANCDANAECVNTPGFFQCNCIYGFTGDGSTCSVIDASLDDLQQNRTNLSLYALRVQLHQEDVERRKLDVEREILLRKCAIKENNEKKTRARRAVTEYDDLSESETLAYLRIVQKYNSDIRLANHNLEVNCKVTVEDK